MIHTASPFTVDLNILNDNKTYEKFDILCTPSKTISTALHRKNLYEPLTTAYLVEQFLKYDEEYIFLDIGAHAGYYSLICSYVAKNCYIHAFEPHPNTFAMLQINLSNRKNCTVHNCAIGTANKQSDFYVHRRDDACSSTLKHKYFTEPNIKEILSVEERIIDSFDIDFSKVKIVKIDVDGPEYFIMNNMYDLVPKGTIFCVEDLSFTSIEGVSEFVTKVKANDLLKTLEQNNIYIKS